MLLVFLTNVLGIYFDVLLCPSVIQYQDLNRSTALETFSESSSSFQSYWCILMHSLHCAVNGFSHISHTPSTEFAEIWYVRFSLICVSVCTF